MKKEIISLKKYRKTNWCGSRKQVVRLEIILSTFYFSVVVSGFVSISALAPLVGTPIGFTSSAVELEISAIMPIIRGKSV